LDRARDDIERVERIAKSTTKSSFMALGETQPKLVSEGHNLNLGGRSKKSSPYKSSNHGDGSFENDQTVPPEVYALIHSFKEKLQ